ncbi:MAG: TerB family tellurite resistance protein [Cucumibacter sp.]
MFDAISRLFARQTNEPEGPLEPKLAVAALLVHLTAVDGTIGEDEREAVKRLLKERYDLTGAEVMALVALATRRDHESVDYYQFTAALSRLEEDERIAIIRTMWELVFTDARNHELEDNMVWRVAELIGISARQRTLLRNEVKRQGGAR